MARATVLAGLVPVDFQEMTLNNSTAVALNSTIRASASVLHISVETNDCRYRADGTDPTLNTGVRMSTTGNPYQIEGFNGTANWKFQRTTGTSAVSILAFKQVGARSR